MQAVCPWLDGLYVNTAHGGTISAPLSGELLAAWLDDEPLPLREVAEACHPNRFLLHADSRHLNEQTAQAVTLPVTACIENAPKDTPHYTKQPA